MRVGVVPSRVASREKKTHAACLSAPADLGRLGHCLRGIDARELLRIRRRCGGAAAVTGVDVSASFLGRRAYNRFDIEDVVANGWPPRWGSLTTPGAAATNRRPAPARGGSLWTEHMRLSGCG
jgi:hypothetical protein